MTLTSQSTQESLLLDLSSASTNGSGSSAGLNFDWRCKNYPRGCYVAARSFEDLMRIYCDWVWMLVCVVYVEMAIRLFHVPIVGETLRRLTFVSGSNDTNADLCLFMRMLYTLLPGEEIKSLYYPAPGGISVEGNCADSNNNKCAVVGKSGEQADMLPPMKFDKEEAVVGINFLEGQYRMLFWLIKKMGLRVMPPLLRPLYITYYSRARMSTMFVHDSIINRDVKQIVILGAGYDLNAYRTHNLLNRNGVTLFEVDLKKIQDRKRAVLGRSNLTHNNNHNNECEEGDGSLFHRDAWENNVVYVDCNFGVESLTDRLLAKGFDVSKPTSVVWEGVTYYLTLDAVRDTLGKLRCLANSAPPGVPKPPFYMLLDYMDTNAVNGLDNTWLWKLEHRLTTKVGSSFITGFSDMEQVLQDFGFKITAQVTRYDSHNFLYHATSDFLGEHAPETKVNPGETVTDLLYERNSTMNHNNPHLIVLECVAASSG